VFRSSTFSVDRAARGARWFRALAGLATAALAVTLVVAPASSASAANLSVLDVEITAVDHATGVPQTTAAYETHGNRVAYRVDFSCGVETCTNTTVTITPPQTNPYGITPVSSYLGTWSRSLLTYNTWTAPAGLAGTSIGGDDVTGKVVSLGDVPAGFSGSFLVVYAFPTTLNRAIVPAQLYPDGFQIVHSATIASPNAPLTDTATAAPVTWNISVPTPSIVMTNPGSVRPGVDATYQIRMNSGAMGRASGNIYGLSSLQAAGNHTVTLQLPAGADYVSSTGDPAAVYDAGTHTLTWTMGSEAAPEYCAGGGWGSTSATSGLWNTTPPCYTPRNVVLNYRASAYTSDPSGCNFDVNVAPQVRVDVTYLDAARTQKSATATVTHAVSCYDPFGRVRLGKDSTHDGGAYPPAVRPVIIPPDVTGLVCDGTGFDAWGRTCTPGQPLATFANNNKYWFVNAYNAGNAPGIATVVENDLDLPDMPVNRIQTTVTTPTPTIDYTYRCGSDPAVSGSAQSNNLLISNVVSPSAGCRFTSATITSGVLAAGNARPADTGNGTLFAVNFHYVVSPGATPGQRTNTATATMTYPDVPELAGQTFPASTTASVSLNPRATVNVLPGLTAGWAAAPTVEGGGQAVPGRNVTFHVRGATGSFGASNDYAPQYFFVAPIGWTIQPGSAAFASGVPAGVAFDYRTVTIDGSPRDVVVASWPNGPTWGKNITLPTMTVVATPTFAVAAGTTSAAWAWLGDSRNIYDDTTMIFTGGRQDTGDADGDGLTIDWVSTSVQNILVSSANGVTVTKEICLPDASAADGCEWIGDPSQAVPVSTTATGIQYRVTIQNTGNTVLSGVVAYDVLPYLGDTGTSDGTAATPRGSTFSETLASVDAQSAGLDLTFSTSTNPPRPEVFGGATTGDWAAVAAGAQAIRAAYSGTLSPGESVSFDYSANVGAEATADSIACNSVAVDTDNTVPSEPPAVCALTAEADLEIEVPERLPLQAGRPGILPFTVTNHGGSALAPATVTIEIPAGVTVTSLTPSGWDCSASGTAPLTGPVGLVCAPVDGGGAVTTIPLDATLALDLPVTVAAAASSLCVPGEVSSRMVDPVLANNEAEGCFTVVAFDAAVAIDKDDSLLIVEVGDEYSYRIEVGAALVGENLTDVVLTDELPANLVFVSASDGGTLSGANPDGTGGTVTWPATTLGAAGEPNAGGDGTTGGTNTSFTRTVTVRVASTATGDVTNTARVVAPDPANASTPFDVTATDTDGLRRSSVTKSTDALPAGVRSGDEVEYTVTLTNSGTVDYTAGTPAALVDDLTGVLDDATFVAGSATILVGGSTTPVGDPVAGRLTWSGALPVGESAVLSYRVTVGDGSTGDLSLVNTAYSSGTVSTCADGLDADDLSCATTSTPFAPVLDKRIASLDHNDDGTWTIVYDIDVTSLDPDADTEYDLVDDLTFGADIVVLNATVTTAPAGVTPEAWSGYGAVAFGVTLPAGDVHGYRLTVVADADTVGGTAAAVCATGVAGGFANVATLAVDGAADETAEACASPVAPTVEKTVAAPVQQPDGTWLVTYTVRVRNSATAPAAGLAYTLEDELTVAAGVSVLDVTVTGPAGAPVNTGFDGSGDTALLSAVDRVPAAASATVPATRVYTVAFHTDVPAGTGSASAFSCPPAGVGGYANTVTLLAGTGTTVLGEDSACADITPLPTPTVTKRVVQTSVDAGSGEWTIEYEIVVTNPSSEFSTVYTLVDDLQYAAAATVVDAQMTSTDATVSATWDGEGQTTAVVAQSLPAGASDVFTVVVVDPSAVDVESAAADCRIDLGETGTGFRNLATVTSGSASVFADACEPATDPSVVKTTVGAPTQNASTGIWTLVYEVAVTNRSTTTVVGGIPYSVADTLEFPTGVEIVDVTATGSGGTVNPDFDGVGDVALASGSIEAALDESTPTRHSYTVTVRFRVPGGLAGALDCTPTGATGGLNNVAEITVGTRTSGATACADVPDVPMPGVAKSVLSQEQQADGSWLVLYRIQVGNPSPSAIVAYDLEDEFAFGAGFTVVGAPTIVAAPAGVSATLNPDWDGDSDTTLVEDVLLPGGGTHTYTVRAVVDTGATTSVNPTADCVLDGGETGTGFTNTASVITSAADADASACAEIYDPGVTKTVAGLPVQQADGSWLVSYTMTVTNPSTLQLRYGLEDVLDFPAGATVTVESAASRAGGPAVVADWDGQTRTQLVASGTALPASAVHVFDVTLRAVLAAGQGSVVDGFANTATVTSGLGDAVRTDADAAADLLVPVLEVEKTATADAIARIGSTIDFEVVVRNTGQGDFTALHPAVVWDDLSGVLDDADLTGAVTASPNRGTVATAGDRVSWRGTLPAGDAVTLTYTVTVTGGGDAQVRNVAFAGQPTVADPATPTVADCGAADDCATTLTALPAVFIEKAASATAVAYGERVAYTVRITNTGDVDLTVADPASFTDDLSGVLDDATYLGDATATIGTVDVTSGVLSWSGPLASGETAVVTYTVETFGTAAGDSVLRNVALVDSTLPTLGLAGETGVPGSASTTTPVRAMANTGVTGVVGVAIAALLLLLGGAAAVIVARRTTRGRHTV